MNKPKPTTDRIAELLAISDPLERATAITAYGRSIGNLPPLLAKQRRADLATGRTELSAGRLAKAVGIAKSGIFRLTKPATS